MDLNTPIEEHERIIEKSYKMIETISLKLDELIKCKDELESTKNELTSLSEKNNILQSEIEELEKEFENFIKEAEENPSKSVEVPKSFFQKTMSVSSKIIDWTIFGLMLGTSAIKFGSGDYVGGTITSAPILLNMLGFRRLGMLVSLGGNLGMSVYPEQVKLINDYANTEVEKMNDFIKTINVSSASDLWKNIGFKNSPLEWVQSSNISSTSTGVLGSSRPNNTSSTPLGSTGALGEVPVIPGFIETSKGGVDYNNASLSLTDDAVDTINKVFEGTSIKDKEDLLLQARKLVGFKDEGGYSQQILNQAIKNMNEENNAGEAINKAIKETYNLQKNNERSGLEGFFSDIGTVLISIMKNSPHYFPMRI